MAEHLTLPCVLEKADSVTVSGPYGDQRSNIAVNVREDDRSCVVYITFDDGRRLRDWLTEILPTGGGDTGER